MAQVSVIIPTYNRGEETLGRAIDSALAQRGVEVEVIVVDDASPQPDEALRARVTSDPRVRWLVHAHNQGGGAARNTGIDAASAPLLALLDSDDWWSEDKLLKNMDFLAGQALPARWGLFNSLRIFTPFGVSESMTEGLRADESVASYLFVRRGQLQTSALLLPTALAREVRFDPALPRLQDWDFYLRLEAHGAALLLQPEPLSCYDARAESGRISSRRDPDFLIRWIEARAGMCTARERAGYMANKVVPELIARGRRAEAARHLVRGMALGVITPRVALIELLRAALPAERFDALRRLSRAARRS